MLSRKVWMMMAVVVVWMMAAAPAQAAGSPWTAWLYESSTGRVSQIDDSGTLLRQFPLPADAGSTFGAHAAVSQDGVLLAYSAVTTSATFINIYDLTTFSTVYSLALSPTVTTSLDFSADAFNFSEGNSTFAFSYTDLTVSSGWQILVIDLVTSSTFALNEGDPAVASIISPGFGFMLPVVKSNRNQAIQFMMIPLGTDGAPRYDGYTWNIASSSIVPSSVYITPWADTLALTGEVIDTLSDDGFPGSRDSMTDFPVMNTLQVYDPLSNERFAVTSIPRIFNARFVQAGERIALIRYEESSDGSGAQSLQVVERSGAIVSTVGGTSADNITAIVGTLNGFVFSAGSLGDSGGTTVYYVETRLASAPFNAVSVWNSSLGANAQVVWVSDAVPTASSAFMAWGRVSPAASAAPTTPPIAAPASLVLTAGGQATVQTTAGDVLNIRSGPGRSFSRLGTVNNGTVVTLLEGPTSADGFIWWRIQLPGGTEGWVVESADGVQTLLPR